ncbi:hypothetical protein BP6252_11167 [Coleophoma cylindrospora]|uniref:Zn(2)-C6 fungal-type domain-containing protein n=1 Tax=Coleophoma cylindrospora TaxID=1849047 RepID=A0A3D8QP97_9HELO|nr:hypothetical protein BP6252_11167 [Coleophoma cylindrospora]
MEQDFHSRGSEKTNSGMKHPSAPPGATAHGSACDQCYRRKERCSGSIPCDRCNSSNSTCTYSLGRPLGKPKGRRNNTKLRMQTTQSQACSLATQNTIAEKIPSTLPESNLDTIIFCSATHENPGLSSMPAAHPSPSTMDLSNPDTVGWFQFIFGSSPPPTSLLSSQDISDFTTGIRNFPPPTQGLPDQINDVYTSQGSLSFSPSMFHVPELTMPVPVDGPSNLSRPRREFPVGIIAALHDQQKSISWASIGETLLVAREGLDAVSQYISHLPPLTQPASIPSTIIIASFLILQQALACCMELWTQAAAGFERGKDGESDSLKALYTGDFHMESSENFKHVLDALIRAEVSRGRSILARLQQVAHELRRVGDDKTGLFEIVFGRNIPGN